MNNINTIWMNEVIGPGNAYELNLHVSSAHWNFCTLCIFIQIGRWRMSLSTAHSRQYFLWTLCALLLMVIQSWQILMSNSDVLFFRKLNWTTMFMEWQLCSMFMLEWLNDGMFSPASVAKPVWTNYVAPWLTMLQYYYFLWMKFPCWIWYVCLWYQEGRQWFEDISKRLMTQFCVCMVLIVLVFE